MYRTLYSTDRKTDLSEKVSDIFVKNEVSNALIAQEENIFTIISENDKHNVSK